MPVILGISIRAGLAWGAHTNDKESCVESFLSDDMFTDLHGLWRPLVNGRKSTDQEQDGEDEE